MARPSTGRGSNYGAGSAKRTGNAPQPTHRASVASLRKTPKDAAPKRFGRGG